MERAQALLRTTTGVAQRHVLADDIVDPDAIAHLGDVAFPDPACHVAQFRPNVIVHDRVAAGCGRIRGVDASDATLAAEFDQHRSRLIGLGYRLTGRLADAEDAVQDAWLRLAAAERPEIHDLGGWLTTVVSRLCLDRMRSATARREHYIGPWIPEPLVSALDEDPGEVVAGQDDLRLAALRVLHELSPDQRLAFVLHDGFDLPFAEIAEVLDCSAAAARQHASRARKVMADAAPPERAPLPAQRRALEEFLAAVASKDVAAITKVLHPDAVVYGDSGGKARTARRPVVGADKVARFAAGLMSKYGAALLAGARPILVNPASSPGSTSEPKPALDQGIGARHASPLVKPWEVSPSAWLKRVRWFSTAIMWVSSTTPLCPRAASSPATCSSVTVIGSLVMASA
ncbi:hypothetical protein GCM10009854_29610 [Saccharopolyspora halophila]|uniref:Uncharacterized protein n=1 Tax=Saccharopolyspora halophila TaxID=405551 RepID=A0ABP5TF72_9PSEU